MTERGGGGKALAYIETVRLTPVTANKGLRPVFSTGAEGRGG